jgi:replicative DNA helicase
MQEPVKTSFSNDVETTALKIPPHSVEAEQAVLGGVFLDKEAWDKVAERVREEDFYRRDHRIIFRAINQLSNEGQPYDIVTVAEWLENHQLLDESGGMRNLAALAENTPSASNISAYADIVRKRSILRQLISATSDINDTVFNPQGQSSEQILEFAEQTVFEIAEQETRGRKSYQNISAYTDVVMERIQALAESKSSITGIRTGYHDLDFKTAGFQRSDLIIIAGRPSMGKTALAVNIAETAAIKDKHSVAIFSMEMQAEQLTMRMMSSLANIDQHKVRTGKLDGDDWVRFTSTVGILQETKMFIDDTPALTPAELRARCRRISREHGLDLVVVDYLQLMQVAGTSENRATEISEISRSLKAMAKELNIPVIALSQLNRSLESRQDKRPVMSDLRESGAIEQDADVIIFIYRDEVYDEESSDKGMAEIIISKQRNGPIGKVKLAFRGQYTRFDNFVEDPLTYDSPSVGKYE